MDVIEASHFEVVKNHLLKNQRHELKVRSYSHNGNRFWEFRIYDNVMHDNVYTHTALSFGSGLKGLSKLVTHFVGGSDDNGSSAS